MIDKLEQAPNLLQVIVKVPSYNQDGRRYYTNMEVPKDKEIITHCRTGLRAEMAYSILRNGGYKARFLNDKVAIIENNHYCCYK